MNFSSLEKLALERILLYVLIFAVLTTFIFIFYLFFSQATGSIKILSPSGGEEWKVGFTYDITWKAKGVDRVGIVLFEGEEPKWIAQNISAKEGKYEWKIYPGQKFSDDYWIAVFEYPWKKNSKIDYSDGAFAVVVPDLASCERLSAKEEWPHVPNDMPGLRRVFITENSYKGNLGGLDGADIICQREAEKQKFGGAWIAFLGGDSDNDLASERIKRTLKGIEGIYVEAKPEATLIRGATCHRVLGKDFNAFVKSFSELSVINKKKLDYNSYEEFDNIWLGRIDNQGEKTCIKILGASEYVSDSEKYSLSVTCQNWSTEDKLIESSFSLPTCYTPEGTIIQSAGLGGFASGIVGDSFTPYFGKYCDESQKIICIEK